MGERASELPPSSLLDVDGLIKLRMQRVFIGALCRQMSSCNQSERDAIFGRDSYERKLSNHHDQGRRQGATTIIEFFSITHTSKNFEGGACVRRRGAPVPWRNGQSKPGRQRLRSANRRQLVIRAFRFAIRIDSPIRFKRIDSNRFVL